MSRPFHVTASTSSVQVGREAPAEVVFTVTNVTVDATAARYTVLTDQPALDRCMQVSELETRLEPGGTRQLTIRIPSSPGLPPGTHSIRVVVSDPANPDERFAEGPRVSVEVPAPPDPAPEPLPETPSGWWKWWLAAGGGGVAAVIAVIGTIVSLMDDPAPIVARVQLEVVPSRGTARTFVKALAYDEDGKAVPTAYADFVGPKWTWSVEPAERAEIESSRAGAYVSCDRSWSGQLEIVLASVGSPVQDSATVQCVGKVRGG